MWQVAFRSFGEREGPDGEIADEEDQTSLEAAGKRPDDPGSERQHWCRAHVGLRVCRPGSAGGLSWPLPDDLTNSALEALLFPAPPPDAATTYPKPDWAHVHSELRRPGVTLPLLSEEYQDAHPNGYGYSRFCELYRRSAGRLAPVMRQHHAAGEALYVDYSGATFEIMDP